MTPVSKWELNALELYKQEPSLITARMITEEAILNRYLIKERRNKSLTSVATTNECLFSGSLHDSFIVNDWRSCTATPEAAIKTTLKDGRIYISSKNNPMTKSYSIRKKVVHIKFLGFLSCNKLYFLTLSGLFIEFEKKNSDFVELLTCFFSIYFSEFRFFVQTQEQIKWIFPTYDIGSVVISI